MDSSVAGEFEGFSVHGKTPETGDGFSDDDTLGSTDNDPVGQVEGKRGSATLGDSVSSDDFSMEGCEVVTSRGTSEEYSVTEEG